MATAAGTAPNASTAYSINITITTNSNQGNPQVTGINGQCLDANGAILRRFSGQGNGASAREVFGDVIDNCPVTFLWAEQQNGTITCIAFSLAVGDPSVSTKLSPFPATSFAPSLSISPGGTLLSTTIVNGNATWDYEGSITTQVGSNTPQTMPYDPDIEVDNIDQ
ncbi:MAG: hypothetical protein ABI811_14985 [Acidobacteriota bacterium]